MPYYNQQFPGYQPGYQPMGQAMPDQLAQLRQPYQMQYQPMPVPTQVMGIGQATPTQSDRIYVQGEAGAAAFFVAPGNSVDLWDSDADVIYQKSADASGRLTTKIFDYTVRDPIQRASNNVQAVSRIEFEGLVQKFNELSARIEQILQPTTGRTEAINVE